MNKDNRQEPRKATGRQGRSLIPFAIAVLVALGLVFSGWGTVYAAQDAQPDDLLYPVKVAVDYLDDLFTVAESDVDLEPSAIGERDGIQIHLWDRDQDRTHIDDHCVLWEEDGPPMYRWGQVSEDDVDSSIPITDTITDTQTISMTRAMSGTLYGPGPCLGDPENCELTAPYGYTYTQSIDDEAPFTGTHPITDTTPAIGFGPGVPQTDVTPPVGNSGSTGTSGKKQGGKP